MYRLRIRDLREDHDLSQTEIANVLGIRQNVYSRYEVGKNEIPLHHLYALSDYYNVSIDYLLGKTNDPTPPEQKKKAEEKKAPAKFNLTEAVRAMFLEKKGREPNQQELLILKKFAETFIDGMKE